MSHTDKVLLQKHFYYLQQIRYQLGNILVVSKFGIQTPPVQDFISKGSQRRSGSSSPTAKRWRKRAGARCGGAGEAAFNHAGGHGGREGGHDVTGTNSVLSSRSLGAPSPSSLLRLGWRDRPPPPPPPLSLLRSHGKIQNARKFARSNAFLEIVTCSANHRLSLNCPKDDKLAHAMSMGGGRRGSPEKRYKIISSFVSVQG